MKLAEFFLLKERVHDYFTLPFSFSSPIGFEFFEILQYCLKMAIASSEFTVP